MKQDNLQKYLNSLTPEEYKAWCDMKREKNRIKRKRQTARRMQNPEYAAQAREYMKRKNSPNHVSIKPNTVPTIKSTYKKPRMSKGEYVISRYLEKNGYTFEPEKTFDDLLNSRGTAKLRLDFYLPELFIAIEFDGEQHYEYAEKFHKSEDDWKRQWDNDRAKDFFCICKGIKMIRIQYNEILKISEILDREIE